MTAEAKEPKYEPRPVDLHGIAVGVRAFLVPAGEIRGSIPAEHRSRLSNKSGLLIGLELVCDTAEEKEKRIGVVFGPMVNPNELAGELEGCAATIVRRIALDVGLDAQEAAQHARRIVREERVKARTETREQALPNVTCDFCSRSVAVIVEGARLCSRHAEELGVRPHGKIGS
jgi:hypothetical protein